ncbi:hypothetical protein JB92DRAFT_66692 [Gautieria morchelliformis]|nr:hypothetical protein JB92DRAFT_66692 [Gautieria morchelliformis]
MHWLLRMPGRTISAVLAQPCQPQTTVKSHLGVCPYCNWAPGSLCRPLRGIIRHLIWRAAPLRSLSVTRLPCVLGIGSLVSSPRFSESGNTSQAQLRSCTLQRAHLGHLQPWICLEKQSYTVLRRIAVTSVTGHRDVDRRLTRARWRRSPRL